MIGIARWWVLGVLAAVGLAPPRAEAHQELYHNIDVDLVETAETGVVRISFTIHAPELLVGFAEAADAMFNERWLGAQSDEDLERLVGLARVYLGERFGVRFEEGDAVNLAEEVAFEDFASMRDGGERQLPAACILATLEFSLPPGARELRVEHAAESEKRLMLVVYRPKAFPAVIDVEAGSSAVVRLPHAPEVPNVPEMRAERGGAILAALVLAGVAVIGFILARWGGRVRRAWRNGGLRAD